MVKDNIRREEHINPMRDLVLPLANEYPVYSMFTAIAIIMSAYTNCNPRGSARYGRLLVNLLIATDMANKPMPRLKLLEKSINVIVPKAICRTIPMVKQIPILL